MSASPEETRPDEMPAEEGGPRMGFLDHIDELRRRLMWAALGIVIGFAVCWVLADQILSLLLAPVQNAYDALVVIRPAEAFMNKVKAAFVGGIFLALPWIFFQAWAFIAPGLYKRERRWVIPVMLAGTILFSSGAAFCYLIALPKAVEFLSQQGEQFTSNITVDYAFSFTTKLLLGLGAVFEMPLLVFALARMEMVTARFLRKKLDIAIFLCFFIAAVITPTPDMMTMTIFAMPMVLLYIISIGVAWLAAPKTSS